MKKNYALIYFLLSIMLCCELIYCKRVIVNKNTKIERFKDKQWLNENSWFKIVPLQEILQKNSQISYKKVVDKISFDYPEFSIASKFPHSGYFEELFILFIPQGRVQGECGY